MGGTRLVGRDGTLVLCAAFFYMASTMLVNPLLTGFTESLGATVALTGVIAAIMSACSLACRPVAGRLADRMSKARLAIIGAGLMCVSCAGYALAQAPAQVGVWRVTNGIGYSLCSVCVSTWFAEMVPSGRIGAGMGVFGTMNALAMSIGPALGLAVCEAWGYRAALVVASGLAGASAVVMGVVRRGRAAASPRLRPKELTSVSHGLAAIVDVRAVPAALVVALFTIPYCAVQSYLVQSVGSRGLDVATGLFFPTYAAALLALRMGLKDEFDRRPFGLFVLAGAASELVSLILLATMRGNVGLVAAAVLMAGGYGVMCSVCQSCAVRLAGPGRSGMANGTYYMGFDAGMFAGPALGGVAYALAGPAFAFVVLAPALAAAVLVWGVCRRSLDGREEA